MYFSSSPLTLPARKFPGQGSTRALGTPGFPGFVPNLRETAVIGKENSRVRLFPTPLPQPESPNSMSRVFLGERFRIPELRSLPKMPKEFGCSARKEILGN